MWAVPNKVIFCSSLMLIAPGIFSVCFCSPFLMNPRAPITNGIVSIFIPHILVVSGSRSSYLESFVSCFNEVFLSDGLVSCYDYYCPRRDFAQRRNPEEAP